MVNPFKKQRATSTTAMLLSVFLLGCGADNSTGASSEAPDSALVADSDVAADVADDAMAIPEVTTDVGSTEVLSEDAVLDGTPAPDADSGPDSDATSDATSDAAPSEVVEDVATQSWPVNPDKDTIPDPGWDSTPAVGTVLPNFTAIDQYGNTVELYDLAMEGKPIVLEIGAWVCEPCKALSWFLATGETGESPHSEVTLDTINWWSESFELIKELVDEGTIRWVTILFSLDEPMTAQDAAAWHEIFTHDEIVVLADGELQIQEYLQVAAMPRIEVLDENMVFLVYGAEYNPEAPWKGGPQKGLQQLVTLYGP